MGNLQSDPSRPSTVTSRRNFVAGATVLTSAILTAVVGPRRAEATHNGNGGVSCNNPGQGQAAHCIVCFLRGTKLTTPYGETAIEDLRIGDLVTTAGGVSRPVKWVARMRHERGPTEAWEDGVRPVRIRAGALDLNTPTRDLFVSGWHSIYMGGVLIPAKDLVNGTSILLEDLHEVTEVEYFHIELASHEIVLAEGAPAESLAATSANRMLFDNYDEFVRLYGSQPDLVPCAPVVGYNGGRGELASRWRSFVAPIFDTRRPLEIARDRIDNLAARLAA